MLALNTIIAHCYPLSLPEIIDLKSYIFARNTIFEVGDPLLEKGFYSLT